MVTYHLTKKGYPGVCKASERGCPLGGEHYDTPEKASAAGLQNLADRKDLLKLRLPHVYNPKRDLEEAVEILSRYDRNTPLTEIFEQEQKNGNWVSFGARQYANKLHSTWGNWKPLVNSKKNLLNAPEKDAGWEANYHHALAEMMTKKADLVSEGANIYGWHDYSYQWPDRPKVEVVLNVREDSWSEFDGTDAAALMRSGYSADVILDDGSSRELRYDGNAEDVLRHITKNIWN